MNQKNRSTSRQSFSKLKKLRIFTATDLLDKTFPSRPWIIENFLKYRQAAMVYSPTGAGKSWFSLSLACVAAGGGRFHTFANSDPRPIIYVDGEMDLEDVQERLKRCIEAVGANKEAVGNNLRIISRQAQSAGTSFFDLNDSTSQYNLLRIAVEAKASLVILDNFSTLVEVEDENSAAAFNKITNFLLTMKQAGIATLLVHHANKAATGFRGSQKLSVTFDVIVKLYRPDDAPHQGCTIELDFEKNRHSMNVEPVRLYLGTEAILWDVLDTEQGAAKAARMLKSLNYTTQADLAKAYGCSTSYMSKLLARAEANGILVENESKGLLRSAKKLQGAHADLDDFPFDSNIALTEEF